MKPVRKGRPRLDATPPINLQDLASDHFSIIGAEEQGSLRYVIGRRQASPWNRGTKSGPLLWCILAHEGREQRCLTGNRCNGVDTDAIGRQLDRHGF